MAEGSFRAYKGPVSFNLRSEWKIFAWCVLIASILWTLTALNESFTSSINVKVKYLNVPRDKVFVKPLPEELKVMVTAKGWDLMTHYFRNNAESITVDLNDYKKADVLVTRRLQDIIQQSVAQKITIGEIFPESISLGKDEKGSRKVPIRLQQEFSYKKQYGLGGEITFSPDSVVISGPATVIKSIDHVDTETGSMADIDKSTTAELKLKDPEAKNISYSVNRVKVQIPVFQLTEQTKTVPVEIINQGSLTGLKLIPENVSVIFLSPINKYNQVDSAQFQAIVDGSQIDTTEKTPLRVQLISMPKYTYGARLKPDYIDYVINK